jgi:nitrate reductase (NAD(P)H)
MRLDETASGEHVAFRFKHPTQPGQETGWWMTTVTGKPDSAGFGRLLEVQGEAMDAQPQQPLPKRQSKS